MRRLTGILVALVFLFIALPAFAVWPIPSYSEYPCSGGVTPPENCQNQGGDPLIHFQTKLSDRSATVDNACPLTPDPFGGFCWGGGCTSTAGYCRKPSILSAHEPAVVVLGNSGPYVVFDVEYDFPNNYCQLDLQSNQTSSWWPLIYNDIHLTRLQILSGSEVIADSMAVFEHGEWTPVIKTGCGVHTYTVRVITKCFQGLEDTRTFTVTVDPENCGSDKDSCPWGVSKPVNVGSGDVAYNEKLFSIDQRPMPLLFALSYHSERPINPALGRHPLGAGWTHNFNQTLQPIDRAAQFLQLVTGDGREVIFQKSGSVWRSVRPRQWRAGVALDATSTKYVLTDLDGALTTFDRATGRWLATTDRWGNSVSGAYTGNDLTAVTDSAGRSMALGYSGGLLTTITLPNGALWRFAYNGALTQIFDPLHTGATPWRSFAYVPDSKGTLRLLTEVRDESVLLEGHTYDGADRGTSSVTGNGRDVVNIAYDQAGSATTVTHVIDGTTSQVAHFSLFYQGGRYLASRIQGNCLTCDAAAADDQTFDYDGFNHILATTDANGHTTRFQYNGDGNVTRRIDAQGSPLERTTTWEYNYAPWPNFVTRIVEPSTAKPGTTKTTTFALTNNETTLTEAQTGYLRAADASSVTYTTTRTFDARHRLLSTDGPRTDVSDVTTTAYFADNDANVNRRGRRQSSRDAAGLTTSFDDYDLYGTPRSVTDANGVRTTIVTDPRGRATSTTLNAVAGDPNEAADYVTTRTWDGRDRLVTERTPRGFIRRSLFEDGTNHRTDLILLDGAGNEVERHHVTFNVVGDVTMEEEQSCASPAPTCTSWVTKQSRSFVYDAHNRLVQALEPDGARSFFTWDHDGLLSAVQDENHSSPNITYGYDALHRRVSMSRKLGSGAAITAWGYHPGNDPASVTDANGNTTTFLYDDFGRLQSQVNPASGTATMTYDPAGNLISSTDANGATVAMTYDAADRILTSASSRSGAPTETVTWTYDNAAAGAYGKGRIGSVIDPRGSMSYTYDRRGLVRGEAHSVQGNAYSLAWGYDADGNRSSMTYPSGRVVNYTFDFAGRPLSASSGGTTYVGNASYLPFGPMSSLTFGNGTTETNAFDQRYRITGNRLNGPLGVIADYSIGHDPAGNVTSIHDLLDSGFNRDFAYDDLHRLTQARTGQSLWGNGSYSYDTMGNMLAMSLGTSRQSTFAYNGSLPKLASATENGLTRAVAYDAAGNEQTVGAGAFSYNARNFLATADGLTYAYDWRGLRSIATVSTAIGTLTGNVTTIAGSPIAGATVTVDGTLNSTSTDASGNFSLNQAAGTFTVTAMKQGFLPETSTAFTLAPGATVNVGTIKLGVAPSVISGTVVSSLGFALNGANVAIGTGNASTDANGNFSLTQPAGTYSATISAPGYTSQTTASFTTQPGDQKSLGTITLTAIPATISGRVVSSTGGAVSAATVTATGTPLGASLITRGADVSSAQQAAATSGRGRPLPSAHIASDAFTLSATTDGSGNFSLQLPAGTFTLTITKTGFAGTTTGSINVGPGTTYATGDVTIDPLGTITGVVVAKTTLAPVTGATVTIVGSLNTTTTDSNGRFTVQQPPGSYAIQVTAQGFAQISTDVFALGPGQTHDAGTLQLPPVALSVYVGYADDLRPSSTFPTPWAGSPNVVFIGSSSPVDAGAVRLDNNTDEPMNVNGVTVDLGRPGPSFNLWGSFVVPAHGTVILTQTQQFNFDTSDYPITQCNQPPLANDPRVPRVTVNIGGTNTTYFDTGHILDTGGFDLACKANESLQWRLIGTTGINSNGDFLLAPPSGTATLGSNYTVTATATDANGQPLTNVTVTFRVISGPNIGRTGTSATNASGQATFTYTGTAAGTDTIQATITNASGGSLTSNPVNVTWPAFSNIEVFVGYADDLRPAPAFPIPWQGSPNVVFIGNRAPEWDSGAVRIDNESDATIHIDRVSVDLQRPGPVFSLWGSFDIPPHFSAILAQTNGENFDTSDFPITGCHGTLSPTDPRIPKITVTIGGQSASYLDTAHILDTFGYDVACDNRNESLQWRPIGGSSTTDTGHLTLLPLTTTTIVGGTYTASAVLTDAGNEPQPNLPIDFRVVTGPNTGKTGRVNTNSGGVATFSYVSTATGTDTVRASITGSTGGVLNSNDVKSIWVTTAAVSLAPPSATNPTGTIYNATATVTDGAGTPLANMNVTFRITSGPNAGKTGTGISAANGTTYFAYTSSIAGTDTIVASVIGAGGNAIQSNAVTATWEAPISIALAPATATQQLGSTYTATATVTSGGSPANGASVTFNVIAGPNAPRTATSATNAAGQATFSYSSTTPGTDFLQATSGSATSNQVVVKWINIPTALQFLGSYGAEYNDPQTFTAKLTEALTGAPIANQTVAFDLGGQTAGGTTDTNGIARVTIVPSGIPGPTPIAVTFAANGAYSAANANAVVSVVRDETAIQYTGGTIVPNGVAQTVSALLTDPDGDAPIANRTITFTIGSVTVSAVTNASGVAATTITVPSSLGTGPARMLVAFAGDAYYIPAQTSVPVILFAPSSFVIWGGNATPPHIGEKVNFWGSQWPKQVTGGDYDNKADLKGWVTLANPPLAQICEPNARQNGTPRLDDRCWSSRPGDSDPPAQLDRYIGVIVTTSVAKQGNEIYGNIAAVVVLRVEAVPQYGPDPGLQGFGTIAAVYADGANLFAMTAPATGSTADGTYVFRHVTKPRRTPVTQLVSIVNDFEGAAIFDFAAFSTATTYANVLKPAAMTVGANNRRYYFYSPEQSLIAETALAPNGAPAIGYEYIWFNGEPVAQVDVGVGTHWMFTDHLGAPIVQTDAAGNVYWRAEYEPFGAVYALRSSDQHQPLRYAGQEAEQLNLGANGVTERLYNVHRWYRPAWGRYTQADPVMQGENGANVTMEMSTAGPYTYVEDAPQNYIDNLGLACAGSVKEHITRLCDYARAAAGPDCPCRVMLIQTGYESGWPDGGPRVKENNYFGVQNIKGSSGRVQATGDAAVHLTKNASIQDSFNQYCRLCKENDIKFQNKRQFITDVTHDIGFAIPNGKPSKAQILAAQKAYIQNNMNTMNNCKKELDECCNKKTK